LRVVFFVFLGSTSSYPEKPGHPKIHASLHLILCWPPKEAERNLLGPALTSAMETAGEVWEDPWTLILLLCATGVFVT